MPRARMIKPEFLTDSKTGTLTAVATKLLVGLLIHADDYGVIRNEPAELKAKIFPFEAATVETCVGKPLAEELVARGLVRVFSVDGTSYLFVVNFPKHQYIQHPSSPLIEGWRKGDTPEFFHRRTGKIPESSHTSMGALTESSHTSTKQVSELREVSEIKTAEPVETVEIVENPESVAKRGSLRNIADHKMPALMDPQARRERRELLKSQIQNLRDVQSGRKGPTASHAHGAAAAQAK
jgi:hypothetical protein